MQEEMERFSFSSSSLSPAAPLLPLHPSPPPLPPPHLSSFSLHFKVIYSLGVLSNLHFQHGRHSSLCFLQILWDLASLIAPFYLQQLQSLPFIPFPSVLRYSFIQQIFIKHLLNTLYCF